MANAAQNGAIRRRAAAPRRRPKALVTRGVLCRRQGAAREDSAPLPRAVEAACQARRPDRDSHRVEPGTVAAARSDPLRAHAAIAIYVLSRRRCGDGCGPFPHSFQRCSRSGLRGLPSIELRHLRHPGAAGDLRHQRFRRNASGPLGMGCDAARRQLRDRWTQQRVFRARMPGCCSGRSGKLSRAYRASWPRCPRSSSGTCRWMPRS